MYKEVNMKRIFLLISVLAITGCATTDSKITLKPNQNSNHKYPVGNGGKNIEYYSAYDNKNQKIRIDRDQLQWYVTWNHAIDMILDQQIVAIFQGEELRVEMEIKDWGGFVSTIQPTENAILEVLKMCADPCQNIYEIE